MIQHTFSAEGFQSTDKLQKYVDRKVKDLEKYIPRAARQSAQLYVRVTKGKVKAETYTCRLSLSLPEQNLEATEKVEHAYSAIDVSMADLKTQIRAYKEKHGSSTLRLRAAKSLSRLRRRTDQEEMVLSEAMAQAEKQPVRPKKSPAAKK